ncbi:uncharacterized protein si:dkey-217m5.8 isoform X5 [Entelurus aequoreus]|uniref:uncharacterized protein si:dkey-217m5.8 isoform X5 n=1 Tax=Entelurus aequoreus TaxID=161455 RepID=UPI002B1DCE5F|nr:uncharacterized protein si:dkey-217m5.8 isoform X5 [Entelurus aequoreus]XP_061900872.1 uncharacterized protein si:dkey-217m5.8 isoform X5 [Entelurus aequoreus]XP_061900873.1 uncharacterized protein si:dkey-217m5.8 isoform X5 [Entelurus aequoreus]
MEVLPNNMVRLETLDGKPKHMMTPYASLKPLRPRTHPGWPKDSPSAPVLPGDAEMLTSSSEEETECHCFTEHTYAGPTPPWKKELHPDQKQLLEYVLACDRPAMELIVKEGGVCLEEFWSLGLSRDMDSTMGNACLQLVQEAAQRHGKDVFIANMYIVPTWKHKDVDPMSSLPRDAHLKDAILFPAWSKHNGPEHYLLCVLRPAKREILLLDSQFALWPSGFGDEVYRAIFSHVPVVCYRGPLPQSHGPVLVKRALRSTSSQEAGVSSLEKTCRRSHARPRGMTVVFSCSCTPSGSVRTLLFTTVCWTCSQSGVGGVSF